MGELWITVSVVTLVLVCLGAGLLLARQYEKKRTAGMRQAARALSFQFLGEHDDGLSAELAGFELFSQGRARKLCNAMRGQGSDTAVSIFDYRYTVGSGKNSQTYRQTVVAFQSQRLALPSFHLRPERWYHKISSLFGYQDIDFGDFPVFSRKYLLRAASERAVRLVFTAPVLETIEKLDGISAEGQAERLIVYRLGRRVKPLEVKHLLEEGFAVYATLAEACGSLNADRSAGSAVRGS